MSRTGRWIAELMPGRKIREVETGQLFEVVSLTGYKNYDIGIERVGVENADTEYIRSEDIGTVYKLMYE